MLLNDRPYMGRSPAARKCIPATRMNGFERRRARSGPPALASARPIAAGFRSRVAAGLKPAPVENVVEMRETGEESVLDDRIGGVDIFGAMRCTWPSGVAFHSGRSRGGWVS
jgi:hypothetical protein